MTVSQLKDVLGKIPGTATVYVIDNNNDILDLTSVDLEFPTDGGNEPSVNIRVTLSGE